jgi:molybdate transport system substrate-binding protein
MSHTATRVLSRLSLPIFLLLQHTVWAQEDITIYAAASLTNALTDIKKSYESKYDVNIKTSFAGSATLAKQIEAGAPAQLFISADTQWMDYLQQHQQIDVSSRHALLGNTLVFIAPKDQPFKIQMRRGFDFPHAFAGKICTGDPTSVPVGMYAKDALQHFGWWTGLEKRLVGTEDVRTALAFVERGECAVGIVYDTDARISNKVVVIGRFPANTHQPIVYPFALMPHASLATQAFYQYLQQKPAQAVFSQYGFTLLPIRKN